MQFISEQIKGHGRGKQMGVPTINLAVPKEFNVEDGVYACKLIIEGIKYNGALHVGPVPTFNETVRTIEIYVLDIPAEDFPETYGKPITVDVVKKIREIMSFTTVEDLVKRIVQDVSEIKKILNDNG